jgi:hypothetical protein
VWIYGVTPTFLKLGQFPFLGLEFCKQDATHRVSTHEIGEACAIGPPHVASNEVWGWVEYPPAVHAKDLDDLVLEQALRCVVYALTHGPAC